MKNKTFNYLTIVLVLILFPLFIIEYFKSGEPITVYTYIGLSLIALALILIITARMQLGASFSVAAQANKLITTGLYSKFRHPIYYSGAIMILGVSFFVQKPEVLLLFIPLFIMQKRRIKSEEKVLEEKFGAEYLEYKKRTWF